MPEKLQMLVHELEKNLWNDRWWIKGGSSAFERKSRILVKGLFMILLILQNIFLWECENWHFLYKNNYVAIGVVRVVIVWMWFRMGITKYARKPYWFFSNCSTLLQSCLLANYVQFSFSSLHLPSMSSFWSYECNFRTFLWFFGLGQGSLAGPLTIAKELLVWMFYE